MYTCKMYRFTGFLIFICLVSPTLLTSSDTCQQDLAEAATLMNILAGLVAAEGVSCLMLICVVVYLNRINKTEAVANNNEKKQPKKSCPDRNSSIYTDLNRENDREKAEMHYEDLEMANHNRKSHARNAVV